MNVLVLNTTMPFSQAPGTQLSFVCVSDSEPSPKIMTTTCQHTGMWNPIPDVQCHITGIIYITIIIIALYACVCAIIIH